MTEVVIKPLPEAFRKISAKYRPSPPPVFPGPGEPTREDVALARELFLLLDPESREWYGGAGFLKRLEAGGGFEKI